MNKIHILTENCREYFIEQDTNNFYITLQGNEGDKRKISKFSYAGAFCAPFAIHLGKLLDHFYIPVSSIISNMFLIIIIIIISIYIYLKWMKKYNQFSKNREPFSIILDKWEKEKILKKSLKYSKFSLILLSILLILSSGFCIKFLLSSELIFYMLFAALTFVLSILLPYSKQMIIRIKMIKNMLKKYYHSNNENIFNEREQKND